MDTIKVLIVEDDEIAVKFIEKYLKKFGYIIAGIAATGEDAIAKCEECKPDVVLMDIELEGKMDGIEAAEKIKLSSDIPVIYLTAHADEKIIKRAKITESFGYIIKPMKERELHANISMALYKNKMEAERNKIEEELQQSKAILGEAQRIAHIGSWELDIVNNKLSWSDEIFRIFEIEKNQFEASYEAFLNVVHPNDREYVNKSYTGSVKNKTPYDITHMLLLNDGRVKYVHERCETFYDNQGAAIRSIGTVQDITESKKAEEALKKYREHLEDKVEERTKELNFQKFALDEHAIVSTTDAKGNITYANDKFCEISGYSRDELMGKNHRIIKSDEHPPEFYRDMWDTISNGKVWHGEVKNNKKDGGFYWVNATIVPFMDENGKPHQYVSIRTNITERKETEKQLNKYASQMEQLAEERSKQLIHADRMVTLGTLSAGIAHEINNPVGFVTNNLQIFKKLWNEAIRASLEKANRENEDKKLTFALAEMPRMVKSMEEGTTRIINIVRSLGKFSRIAKHAVEPSNIGEIIEAALNFCRLDLTVKHKYKVQLDLSDDIPNININRQEIEQVLINLITNSCHAMEGITDKKDLTLKISASHIRNNVVIELTDNGNGMDDKTIENIFNPFFTTKKIGKGTGLGLSVCRGIIEQHSGTITARSKLGEGTTFTIKLPFVPRKTHAQ